MAPKPPPPITAPGGQVAPGNINLLTRPRIVNPDGSVSSVRSMSFRQEREGRPHYGREVLVPTAIPAYRDSKGVLYPAHIATDEEAITRYYRTGRHLGVFNSVAAANRYAQRLHLQQAKLYGGR